LLLLFVAGSLFTHSAGSLLLCVLGMWSMICCR